MSLYSYFRDFRASQQFFYCFLLPIQLDSAFR